MSDKPSKPHPTATERRAQQAKNPYNTTSASARRARERASGKAPAPSSAESRESGLTTAQISDLLDHPTKFVSEAELRTQYAYVLQDLRSMAILTAALFALLVALALLLPQVGA
jgi:hypothetical protein